MPGAVEGDVAAPLGVVELGAKGAELCGGKEEVVVSAALAEGVRGRVLEGEEGVGDGAGLSKGDEIVLEEEGLAVAHHAHLPHPKASPLQRHRRTKPQKCRLFGGGGGVRKPDWGLGRI